MPVKTDSMHALTGALQPTKQAWHQAAGRVLAESGLSLSLAAPILVVSRLGDGALQHVIAEQIGVHPAALVRTLDQAAEAGLLERRAVPKNRRLRAIYLLPEGRRLAAKMEQALTTLRATLLKDIPKTEIDTAVRVLQAFEERSRRYAEQERSSTVKTPDSTIAAAKQ